jgi:hypothetical protein
VSDQGRVVAAMFGGALVGGMVGYVYLTASGRRLREQIEPRLDEALHEIGRLRQTIGKAQSVASEGWRSLNQVAGSRSEWASPRQSSPY